MRSASHACFLLLLGLLTQTSNATRAESWDITAFDDRTGYWYQHISASSGEVSLCGIDASLSFNFSGMLGDGAGRAGVRATMPAYRLVLTIHNDTEFQSGPFTVMTRTAVETRAVTFAWLDASSRLIDVPGELDLSASETAVVTILFAGSNEVCMTLASIDLFQIMDLRPVCSMLVTVFGRVASSHAMAELVRDALHIADASVSLVSFGDEYDQWLVSSADVCTMRSQVPILVVRPEASSYRASVDTWTVRVLSVSLTLACVVAMVVIVVVGVRCYRGDVRRPSVAAASATCKTQDARVVYDRYRHHPDDEDVCIGTIRDGAFQPVTPPHIRVPFSDTNAEDCIPLSSFSDI